MQYLISLINLIKNSLTFFKYFTCLKIKETKKFDYGKIQNKKFQSFKKNHLNIDWRINSIQFYITFQ